MDTILLFMLPAGLWAQDAGVAATTAAPDATAGALGELATGLNTVWTVSYTHLTLPTNSRV